MSTLTLLAGLNSEHACKKKKNVAVGAIYFDSYVVSCAPFFSVFLTRVFSRVLADLYLYLG